MESAEHSFGYNRMSADQHSQYRNVTHDFEEEHYVMSPTTAYPQRATARGVLLTLLVAFGILGVSAGSARYLFPRGASGRVPAADGTESVMAHVDPARYDANVQTTTDKCAGNAELPVLDGVDVVAYYSLEDGEGAVYGYEEHESILNGYRFYFASEENKELFEERFWRYLPAWGGFCSWGIAMERWWAADILGPETDPNSWYISPDGVLHLFRSEKPKSYFLANLEPNIVKGNEVWASWFGDLPYGANGGAPLDTNCFCSVSTCQDG